MRTGPKNDNLFQPDEMNLRTVNALWNPKDLLSEDGMFYLKDIVKILKLDPLMVKRKAREMKEQGHSAWKVMGTRKVWSHWMVRMKVFAPYYRKHLVSKIKRVDPLWDANILLEQKGLFTLTDVCRKLPFTTYQLRYQAKKNPRAKEEYGIWKDRETNNFVVDMKRFGPWIKGLWGFAKPTSTHSREDRSS